MVTLDLCPNCGWRLSRDEAHCPFCGFRSKEPEQTECSAWGGFVALVLGIPYLFLGGALLFWGPSGFPWIERLAAFVGGAMFLYGLMKIGMARESAIKLKRKTISKTDSK